MKKQIFGMICAFVIMAASFPQSVSAWMWAPEKSLSTTFAEADDLEWDKLYEDVFTAEKNTRYCKIVIKEMSEIGFNVNSDAKGEVRLLDSRGKVLTKWQLRGENTGFSYLDADTGRYNPELLLNDLYGHWRCEEEILSPGTYYIEVAASKEQFDGNIREIRFDAMGAVEILPSQIVLSRTSAEYTGKKIAMPKVKALRGTELERKPDKSIKYDEVMDWRTGKRVKSIKNIGRYLICNKYFETEPNFGVEIGTSCALFTVTPQKGVLKAVESKKKGQIQVAAKKNAAAGNYQIQISTDKKFKKKVQTIETKNVNQTVKNLRSGKKYYARVRYYKNVPIKYMHGLGKPEPIYGKWSKAQAVVCK